MDNQDDYYANILKNKKKERNEEEICKKIAENLKKLKFESMKN